MSTESTRELELLDLTQLMTLPAFRRFLFRIMNDSGIWLPAYGSDGRNLAYAEGRRSLGLDILGMADKAAPIPRNDSAMTIMAILSEAAKSIPQEKPNGRRSDTSDRYDRSDD